MGRPPLLFVFGSRELVMKNRLPYILAKSDFIRQLFLPNAAIPMTVFKRKNMGV